MPANPANCLHGNTWLVSRTMFIDECRLCGGYLVWCENPTHDGKRHWHIADTRDDAMRLASGPFDRARGANTYGVTRPTEPAPVDPDTDGDPGELQASRRLDF